MGSRQTLYELLGVPQGASLPALQAAYRHELGVLELARGSIGAQEYGDKAQLLRLALSTLADPVTRLGYDNKLAASSRADPGPATTRAIAPRAAAASAEVRADALSLRADALALRADAMLMRTGVDLPANGRASLGKTVASGAMVALQRFVSALGILVVVGIVAFAITRLVSGDSGRRAATDGRANEQTAIQEYYQTHGVRPANMAELELLEADRKRRDNQRREVNQDREKQERDARNFAEEAKRRGQEVDQNLRAAEYQARIEAERERREAQMKQDSQRAREEAEQMRIEREKQRWRESLRQ